MDFRWKISDFLSYFLFWMCFYLAFSMKRIYVAMEKYETDTKII